MKTAMTALDCLLVAVLISRTAAGYKVACYYTSWSQYRVGDGQYNGDNIDFSLCTHIVYAFATIDVSRIALSDPYNDEGRISKLQSLRQQYESKNSTTTKLSVLVQSDPTTFSALARVSTSRQAFVNSTIQFLRGHGLDGVELDWSYPSQDDRPRFTQLCQELLQGFIDEGKRLRKERLLISVAVSAVQDQIVQSYEIQLLSDVVDWINLKAYNLFPNQDYPTTTRLHSALFGSSDNDIYSVDYAVSWWLSHGMNASKILLGMPTFGRTFILSQPSNHDLLSAAKGNGRPSSYTRDLTGSIAYYAVCADKSFQQNKIRALRQREMYSWADDTWVSFDDEELANEKCSYVKNKKLGGVAIWSLDLDDFTGKFCSRGTYPLLRNVSTCLLTDQLVVTQRFSEAPTTGVHLTTASPARTITLKNATTSTPTNAGTSTPNSAGTFTPKSGDDTSVATFPQFVQIRLLAGGFSCRKPMAKAAALLSGAHLLNNQWASIYALSLAVWMSVLNILQCI